METLLETLSKLKESGVILSDYTRLSTKEMFVQPIAINRLIRRLGDISGKPVAGIDVNKLYGKVTAAVTGKIKRLSLAIKKPDAFLYCYLWQKTIMRSYGFCLIILTFRSPRLSGGR